jgi:hypothetical protein
MRKGGKHVAGGWDEPLLRDARRQLDKEVFVVVEKLVKESGFTLRKQGHKFGLYSPWVPPPGDRAHFVSVPGTAQNPGNAAKRILRAAKRCPGQHEAT